MGFKKTISCNPSMAGIAEVFSDITYAVEDGVELKMDILSPWWDREGEMVPYPTILFVQGSGWTFPNVGMQLPQLGDLARKGYVVATITHRNAVEGHPFPACLQDVKTAIRFLRAHGDEYAIDTNRIGVWGTSSGGNLALLSILTQGDERYESNAWKGYSENVDFCVACFPPTNLVESELDPTFDADIKETFRALSDGKGQEERLAVLREMSPYHIVADWVLEGKKVELPPIFLAHGNQDMLIAYHQSLDLCRQLERLGADVSFVTVDGAPHEGPFWSREMLDLIFEFIKEKFEG